MNLNDDYAILRYECITCKAQFKVEEKEKIERHDQYFNHPVMPIFKKPQEEKNK